MNLKTVDSRDLIDLLKNTVIAKELAFKKYSAAQVKNIAVNRLQLLHKNLTNEEIKIAAIQQEILARIERSSVDYIQSLADATILSPLQAENLIKVCSIIREKQSASMTNTRFIELIYKDDATIKQESETLTELIPGVD